MDNELKALKNLEFDKNIFLKDIPQIDLYMDQVIQLFENTFSSTKRNEEEKVLTKTMINNYAKGKLLVPIKNKRYSKEHLILLSLIYQLKSGLSINDIKVTLDGVNKRILSDEAFNLEEFYQSYLNIYTKNATEFKEVIDTKVRDVSEELDGVEDANGIEKVLLILSFITASQFYRRAAETLVDELVNVQEEKKEK